MAESLFAGGPADRAEPRLFGVVPFGGSCRGSSILGLDDSWPGVLVSGSAKSGDIRDRPAPTAEAGFGESGGGFTGTSNGATEAPGWLREWGAAGQANPDAPGGQEFA